MVLKYFDSHVLLGNILLTTLFGIFLTLFFSYSIWQKAAHRLNILERVVAWLKVSSVYSAILRREGLFYDNVFFKYHSFLHLVKLYLK